MGIRKWTVPLAKLWLCFVLAVSAGAMIDGISVKAKYAKNIYGDDRQEEFSMEREVSLNGVSLYGLTQEEAIEQVTESYHWYMTVYYGKHPQRVKNLMEVWVRDAVEAIYDGEEELPEYDFEKAAEQEAERIAKKWESEAAEPCLSSYDAESGEFLFEEGSSGKSVDTKELANEILEAVESGDYQARITAKVYQEIPEKDVDERKEQYQILSTFTTQADPSGNRGENIRLACEALNGMIVEAGEEFSFNDATGPRTTEKGYLPATAYQNGVAVQEPGGGVCQVSTTLYNAVIQAGLKSTERHAHSYEPTYVTPGNDATVSYGGPDFKFVNNSDDAVGILASFENGEVKISIYGIPVLEEGEKVYMESENTGGKTWQTYLVRYQDGEVVEKEKFHISIYK